VNQAVLDLLNSETKKYKVEGIENVTKIEKTIKVITIKCITKKYRCPICNKFTSSIHDILKPIKLKYLKIVDFPSEIYLIKRRFICHKCNKKFTEPSDLNSSKCNISNQLKIKIRKDLLNYNLSIKYIAIDNNVSDVAVRNELLSMMNDYPKYLTKLPKIVSFDEFRADTSYGKYAFIINDPIAKKALDILPCRKKDYLIFYFTKIRNCK